MTIDPPPVPCKPDPSTEQSQGEWLQAFVDRAIEHLQIRALVETLTDCAAHHEGGKFVVASYGDNLDDPEHPKELRPIIKHVLNRPGCADEIIRHIEKTQKTRGANTYIMPALVRDDLPLGKKGGLADVVATLAIVLDFDDADAKNWHERVPMNPYWVVETSPGRFQCWYNFEKPEDRNRVEPILSALVRRANVDPTSKDTSHVFRVPGFLNWPNKKKYDQGRTEPVLARMRPVAKHGIGSNAYTLDEIEAAIIAKWPDAFDEKAKQESNENPLPEKIPFSDAEIRAHLYPGSTDDLDRSVEFSKFVYAAKARNYTIDETQTLAIEHKSSPIVSRFKSERLIATDVERWWKKIQPKPRKDGFIRNADGAIIPGKQQNIPVALGKLGVRLRFNRFHDRMIIEGLSGVGPYLDDEAMRRLWLTVDERFKFRPGKEFFWDVCEDIARRNSFHPVREYLGSLRWDGVARLDTWLTVYGGAEDTAFNRAVGAIVLKAAVRRVMNPGCKFDEMLVLESSQGADKSSAMQVLAVNEEWFSDDLPLNADGKRVIEALAGRWIVEAAELKGMRKGDVEHLKAFLSRQRDRARMSYGRLVSEHARQCVIVGTTNSDRYLRDGTGNRRFWPVKIKQFDLDALREDRDQLWAEAAHREAQGESIRLDPSLYAAAAAVQAEREVEDPFESRIADVLQDMTGKIRAEDVWSIVGIKPGARHQEHNARLGEAMKRLGWDRKQLRFGHGPEWAYVKGKSAEREARIYVHCNALNGEFEGVSYDPPPEAKF